MARGFEREHRQPHAILQHKTRKRCGEGLRCVWRPREATLSVADGVVSAHHHRHCARWQEGFGEVHSRIIEPQEALTRGALM